MPPGTSVNASTQDGGGYVSGLLIAAIVFGTVFAVELPDNSGLASLVLGTRYRPAGVFAGTAAAFSYHARIYF